MRLNRGREFVIGEYLLGASTFDALVFGYYEAGRLVYVGRIRGGFTPAVRAQLWRLPDGRYTPAPSRNRPVYCSFLSTVLSFLIQLS
jgi:hypothetical protein